MLAISDILERRFWLHVIARDNTVFDTRFAVASHDRGLVKLFWVLAGNIETERGRVAAPAAFFMAQSQFAQGNDSYIRVGGEHCEIVDLQLAPSDCHPQVGASPLLLELSAQCHRAAQQLISAVMVRSAEQPADMHPANSPPGDANRRLIEDATCEVLNALTQANVLRPIVRESVVEQEPAEFVKLVAAIDPYYRRMDLSLAASELADAAGISSRTFTRLFGDVAKTFGLIGDGFRDSIVRTRLRTAVMLLSIPGVTSNEVAKALGYNGLPALALALREAGLPPPQTIAKHLRGEE